MVFNRRNIAHLKERVLRGYYLDHSKPFEDETPSEILRFAREGGVPPPRAAALSDLAPPLMVIYILMVVKPSCEFTEHICGLVVY